MRARIRTSYRGRKNLLPAIELLFGLYFTGALWFAVDAGIYTSIPFIVLFQVGFLYVWLMSLVHGHRGSGTKLPIHFGASSGHAQPAA